MNEIWKIMEERSLKSRWGVIRDPRVDGPVEPTLLEVALPETDKRYDYFQVDEFAFDQETGCVRLKVTVSLVGVSPNVKIVANIYNEEHTAVTAPMVAEGKNTAFLELIQTIDSIDRYNSDLTVHVVGEYMSNGQTQHPFKAVRLQQDARRYARFVESYDYRPKKEKECVVFNDYNGASGYETREEKAGPGTQSDVVISLFRKPDNVSDCDYICKCSKGKDGHPFVCLPVKGKIELLEGEFAADYLTATVLAVHLDQESGGAAFCMEEKNYSQTLQLPVTRHSRELLYENHEAFGMTFKEPGGSTSHHFRFEMSIMLQMEIGGEPQFTPAVVTSDPNHKTAVYNRIPNLNLMWGCMAENTRIRMEDGRYCPVQNVRIGERIRGRNGVSLVVNIWKGMEPENCMKLTFDCCGEQGCIILTKTHPVGTPEGWKTAGELKAGELLLAEQGNARVLGVEPVHYEGIVWNLELDECREMIAEGIIIGDFQAENGMM